MEKGSGCWGVVPITHLTPHEQGQGGFFSGRGGGQRQGVTWAQTACIPATYNARGCVPSQWLL